MGNIKKYRLNSVNIVQNKRLYYEYRIEQTFEAGISLKGWEVKTLRSGKINITDSYVSLKNGEAFLFGTVLHPLISVSSDITDDSRRNRKLLLKKHELKSLYSHVKQKGYTIVVLSLYWKNGWIKTKIGISKGKKRYDKRSIIKERVWLINKALISKRSIH